MATNPAAILAASVAGGPTAAKEAAVGANVNQPNIVQQALNNVAANAGALDAPAAFTASQQHMIAAPLAADVNAGNARASAQNAYSGAISAGKNAYMSGEAGIDSGNTQSAVQRALEMAVQGYNGYQQTALRNIATQQYDEDRRNAWYKSQATTTTTKEDAGRTDNALQLAAEDKTMTAAAYAALKASLTGANDANEAMSQLNAKYPTDKDGNLVVGKDADGSNVTLDKNTVARLNSYIQQAFPSSTSDSNNAAGKVLMPGTPEYNAFMDEYANTGADGNTGGYGLGQ